MKKVIVICLLIICVITLLSCGSNTSNNNEPKLQTVKIYNTNTNEVLLNWEGYDIDVTETDNYIEVCRDIEDGGYEYFITLKIEGIVLEVK